jgi:hypothetical protein
LLKAVLALMLHGFQVEAVDESSMEILWPVLVMQNWLGMVNSLAVRISKLGQEKLTDIDARF